MKSNKFVIEWKGDFYDCEWFDGTDFEKLENVGGCHGFVFDKNEMVCIARWKEDKYWGDVGGGHEEYDKTFEDTFIREVDEEVDLEIKDIQRLGYVKSVKRSSGKIDYGLRFIAKVKKIKPQTIDPAEGEIPERKFVKPEDFNKFCNWGESGEFQIKKALEKLEK